MFSIGIVGLPNAGKSTLFQLLTKKQVDIAAFPFTTINPNIGVVAVPDQRLEKIAEIIKPQKVTPTIIEFIDIAGLIRGAHKGEGLGNQFLAHIRECDAILHLIRAFETQNVTHIETTIDPKRDEEIVNTELALKDIETLEKISEKLTRESKSGSKEAQKHLKTVSRAKAILSDGKLLNDFKWEKEEQDFLNKELQLLTIKPVIKLINCSNNQQLNEFFADYLKLNLKLEGDITELTPQEQKELNFISKLDQLIDLCYNSLDLLTFYTVAGGQEVRAWTLKKGQTALDAAGLVHTDFQEKFVRAETINWKKLVEAGGWTKARENGWLQTVGKNYIMQDGDVIEFKI